jgi:hypothetical protein
MRLSLAAESIDNIELREARASYESQWYGKAMVLQLYRRLFGASQRQKHRCLFVTHKWGDAAPGTGESVTIPHLIDTYVEWGGGSHRTLWTDEVHSKGHDLATVLEQMARSYRPDIIVYTPIPSIDLDGINIKPDVMRSLPGVAVTILFDHAQIATRNILAPYAEASDLCVSVDGNDAPFGRRLIALWPARTRRRVAKKNIDLSFLGARRNYPDRVKALELLSAENIEILTSGGRAENLRSFKDYFSILDRSIISLNFNKSLSGYPQLKARVIEAISCGCCLVEDHNEITTKYLERDKEFLMYDKIDDLPEFLKRLLADLPAAKEIGMRGRAAFDARLSATKFWTTLINAL